MNNTEDSFRSDLMDLWRGAANEAKDPAAVVRQISSSLRKFDRRVFWRNAIEYGAAVIVVIRSFLDIASGERLLIAPLTSIAVAVFVGFNIWRSHRMAAPVDPTANAHQYRIALLDRIDRQIEFVRGVPYWYVLPAWIFFVTVLLSGIAQGLPVGQLLAEFGAASALCVVVIVLNARYGARRFETERDHVYSTMVDDTLRWTTSSVLKMQYELKVGDQVVATLKFQSLMRMLAVGEGFGGCWTFDRVGFWKANVAIRTCNSDSEIATFKRHAWHNGGTLILPGNRELSVRGNAWMTQLEVRDAAGEFLARLKIRGLMQSSAEVEILPVAQDLAETPWLVMFCWYFIVSTQMNMGG